MFALRPHQEANIGQLLAALQAHGGALDGSDTGTGKTFTAVGLCRRLGARPAIITRKAVIPSWVAACRAADVAPLFIANYEACRSPKFAFGRTLKGARDKLDYEWLIDEPRTLFIFDESQSLRGQKTVNSRLALAARRRFKTLLLSATPFQTPLEAHAQGVIVGLFNPHSYFSWMVSHGVRRDHFGHFKFVGDRDPERGRQIMAKINAELFPARGCRTRREDIPGFPATLILCEAMETGCADEITRAHQAEIEALRELDHAKACAAVDPEFHELVEALPITRVLRARQEAEVLKARAIAELATLAAEKGQAVAVFVNFDATLQLLGSYLKCDCLVRGEDSGRARHQAVTAFQYNKSRFILVNIRAGGAGLSLHDALTQKPRTALISPPYSAVDLRQVLGRTHRLGGGHSTQKLLFAAGTVEEDVMRRVQNRLDNLDALLDADVVIRR